MAGSMKEIKLRIRSVESTMQITKAMELVASSKLRRAKERVEGSRPYFETLYSTLYDIVSADSGFDSPYLVRRDTNRRLYIVIAGARGLAATTPISSRPSRRTPRARTIAYCPSAKRPSSTLSAARQPS